MRLPIVGGPLPIFHGMPPTRSSKKNNNKKEKNNNKKIIRSLQNTTKKTRRKLKEEEDLNDKLTNKLQKCRAQRLSKNKSEKKEVSGEV